MEDLIRDVGDGRTILVQDDAPVLVHLLLSGDDDDASWTGTLVITTENDKGATVNAKLPFAEATVGAGKTNTGHDRKPNGFAPDFRLDMN